jgi:hypothetical protein
MSTETILEPPNDALTISLQDELQVTHDSPWTKPGLAFYCSHCATDQEPWQKYEAPENPLANE